MSGTVPYTEQTQIHLNTIKYTIIIVIIIIMAISYMIPPIPHTVWVSCRDKPASCLDCFMPSKAFMFCKAVAGENSVSKSLLVSLREAERCEDFVANFLLRFSVPSLGVSQETTCCGGKCLCPKLAFDERVAIALWESGLVCLNMSSVF